MAAATVVGVDFDNTLVSYDHVFAQLAREAGLPEATARAGKRAIRDALRRGPGGDLAWQRLQAAAYGPRILEAHLIDGVAAFFAQARARGAELHIVSHKTVRSSIDETGIDLRQAALAWLEREGFFDEQKWGLPRARVHFAATRAEKVATIARLGCAVFVDDLEETFREASFPTQVRGILFASTPPETPLPGVTVAGCWDEIAHRVWAP